MSAILSLMQTAPSNTTDPVKNKDTVPDCFYRVSIKALILDSTRTKFMIVKETNGKWELPGGGLDWGQTPQTDLPREIAEEMGLETMLVADRPSYFITFRHDRTGTWCANVLYEASVRDFDIVPSRECSEIRFIKPSEVPETAYSNLVEFAKHFDPVNHKPANHV